MEYHMFDSARDEKIKSLLSIVYPNRRCPTQSRFESFFKREISKDSHISSPIWEGTVEVRPFPIRSKKTKFKFKLNNIIRRTDDRTTVMIKNISHVISKERLTLILSSCCNINYIYIPMNTKKKILGFAFVNVIDCQELIKLYNLLHCKEDSFEIRSQKPVHICYSKMQGIDELIKAFGGY